MIIYEIITAYLFGNKKISVLSKIIGSHGIHIGTVHVLLVTAQVRSGRYRVFTG